MDPLGTVRRRLVCQRVAGSPFGDVAAAVRWLGAVQAQEYAEAKWSLAERVVSCVDSDVEAAFTRGDIIRTHVLRPTWHFVAAEDLRWLLRLTRPRVHALNRYYYRQLSLDAEDFARGHEVLAGALAGGVALTRRELAAVFAAAGIEADGMRLAYLLMHAELEALICSGPRKGKQHTYALVADRVPASVLDDLPREQALDELVVRYFRSHGPATIKDFTTWSSLTVADTKAALDRFLGSGSLVVVEDDGGKAWFAAVGGSPVAAPARLAGAFLIPTYDETIVAYQDLRVALAHEPPRPGLLLRCIVIDGRTFGSWKRTFVGSSAVVVEALLFGALTAVEAAALDEVVARLGRFLGMPASLEVRTAT